MNTRFIHFFCIFSLLLLFCSSSPAQKASITAEDAVKACFAGYRKAILEGKGREAIKWTTSHTLQYYAHMLNLSLTADSLHIQELSIMDKLMVFTVRHRIPKAEALQTDGNSFFIYAIDQGMIGKNSVINITLGAVKVEGNFARGEILSNGQKAPFYFHFNKEDAAWKIDLTSVFPAANMGLKKVMADSGQSEEEYLFQMLEITTGRKPKASIWQPLKE